MEILKEIIGIGIFGLIVIYGTLKIGLAVILSPRSRKEITGMMVVSVLFLCLLSAIPILAKDVTLQGLLTEKPGIGFYLYLGLMLLFIIGFYKNYRLRFKGQETVLLERNTKYLNFMFNDGGRYMQGKDRKVYAMTYQYIVDGKTYHSKKYVLDKKLNYLTTVLYDPANPKRNIPVPAKHVDGIKY